MPRHTIESDGHTIEVGTTGVGPEWVSYDGTRESSKFTFFGGDHVLKKEEDGQSVQYDVSIRSGLLFGKVTIRKNGVIIYTNR
jgi:hypothetical protein